MPPGHPLLVTTEILQVLTLGGPCAVVAAEVMAWLMSRESVHWSTTQPGLDPQQSRKDAVMKLVDPATSMS